MFLISTTFRLYIAGLVAFSLLLFVLISLGAPSLAPAMAIASACILIAATSICYFLLSKLVPDRGETEPEGGFGETVVWWGLVAASVAGLLVFAVYVETTASLELVKRLLWSDYVSTVNEEQVRLSTAFMPLWAQIVFEAARRFALPAALLMTWNYAAPKRGRGVALALLSLLLMVYVFGTLDRVVALLYVAIFYFAHWSRTRTSPLLDKWFYLAMIAAFAIVAGFKLIQYGHVTHIRHALNPTVTEYMHLEKKPKQPQTSTASKQSKQEEEIPDAEKTGFVNYAIYTLLITGERVLLSPVAMTLYAFENYNEANFQHWRTTRVFSLLGFGRYVNSLEKGTDTQFHDAFPVTVVGDLWRNGGWRYLPIYGILMAGLLFALDHIFFRSAKFAHWQGVSWAGVLCLFYGNAFSATTLIMTVGSLACHFLIVAINHATARRQG